jgi:hypothetical protein
MLFLILALAVGETSWALLCAYLGVDILVFYAVLVAVSALFWIPGLTETRAATKGRPEGTAVPGG